MSNRDPRYGQPSSADFNASSSTGSGQDQAKAKGQQAMDQASQKGQQAREKASQATDQAQARADQSMDKAAAGTEQAADKLREQGAQRGGTAGTAATKTADTLDSASGYLRDKDTDQLVDDLEALIRRKPTESLLVAAGVGFVLSRIFR